MDGKIEQQPTFNYGDIDLDYTDQISFLREMQEAIYANPDAYEQAVRAAGETATSSLFLSRIPDVKPIAEREPGKVVEEYFAEGHNLGVGFDPATEHALNEDTTYRDIIDTLKTNRGSGTSGNTVRLKHLTALRIFVGRVAAWSIQEKTDEIEQAS